MCGFDPFTIMMITTAASSVFNASSKVQEGEDRQAQLNYQASQANFQAAQADADAQAVREEGEVRADMIRRQAKVTRSEARADLAAAGLEVTAGTPLKIDETIVRRSEADAAQEVLYGARRGARLDQDAALQRQNAGQYVGAGERARSAGERAAFGSILAGGAQIAKGWKTAAKAPTLDWSSTGSFDDGTVRIG